MWILPRSWNLLKESIHILIEGVRDGINVKSIEYALCQIEGVINIHELHVWSITIGKVRLTGHIVVDTHHNCELILAQIRQLLATKFHIVHSTLQHELRKCIDHDANCNIHII